MDKEFIGTFQIVKKLGQGGQGEIYLAWDTKKSKYIVVKRIRKQILDGIWEAQILRSLHHPGLPELISQFTDDESLCLVMDYIPGITVKDYIRKCGKVSEKQTVLWGIQLLDILGYLHQKTPPVIHCDIKPSNLMIRKDGTLSLIDFGTAKSGNDRGTGQGTHGYAAPEQMDPMGRADERSDIYSFGITLYHMATGNHPVEKPWNEHERYRLSKGFVKVLKKCLKENKEDRYHSVLEVEHSLKRVSGKRSKLWYGTAAVLAVGVFSFYCGIGRGQESSAYSDFLARAQAEVSKSQGKFSNQAVQYYEKAIEEEPGQTAAYERLLRYYQSAGKEKEGLLTLTELVESTDFHTRRMERLLYTMGLLYLQGKEGTGGYPSNPVLAYRYLSMQERPSAIGKAYTELAGILAGGDYQTDSLWKILNRIEDKAGDFRQLYFLFQIYQQKEQELNTFGDIKKKQKHMITDIEKMADSGYKKRIILREKEAFYESMAGEYGLDPWLEAADQYMEVIDQQEDQARLQVKMARMLAEYKRNKEAEKMYEAVIRQFPEWIGGYAEYGFYLAGAGKRGLAIDMYHRAKKLGAGSDTEVQRLGAILGEEES